MSDRIFTPGHTAVITGAASGIGLAAARRLIGMGMNVVMADRNADALRVASAALGSNAIRAEVIDVAQPDELRHLQAVATQSFGEVNLLMNNAATGQNRRDQRRAGLCSCDVDAGRARRRGQHRLQTGDHTAARQQRL